MKTVKFSNCWWRGHYLDRDLKPIYVTNEACDKNCKANKMNSGYCTDNDCICDYPGMSSILME